MRWPPVRRLPLKPRKKARRVPALAAHLLDLGIELVDQRGHRQVGAIAAGLDGEAVLDVIGKGAAGSWQMENRGKTMLADKFDFGFAVDWMRKDLSICLAEADANGAALPVTALIDQFYKDVQGMGGGRWDTSSLIRRLG